MQLTFLGTSAANAYPEAFCSCANCQDARRLGGPSLRRRSAALVNDDLLLDLGPDIHTAAAQFGLPLTGVRYCLLTHAHADHLDASHLLSRSREYGTLGAPLLHLYASPASLHELENLLRRDLEPYGLFDPRTAERLNLALHPVEAYQAFSAGDYRVTAFPARHDPAVEPLLYAVLAGGRSLFYGADTALLPDETWQAFHRCGLTFDLVILDHTYGPEQQGGDHLSARQVSATAARLRFEGLLRPGGQVYATHIAHEGNPPHPELSAYADQHGYRIAYNGLTLNLEDLDG